MAGNSCYVSPFRGPLPLARAGRSLAAVGLVLGLAVRSIGGVLAGWSTVKLGAVGAEN